ncbi:MAG: PaaI family thioesterase [Bacteroidota bacterium]
MTPKNPHYEQTIREKLKDQHFMRHIGFNLTHIQPGEVEGELILEQHHKQQNGFLHGGVTATVADLVMGFAAYTLVDTNEGTVTSDLKVAYMRPGLGQKIIGRGKVIKAGNLLFYCEADIISVDEKGAETLIARGYSTMCAIKIG